MIITATITTTIMMRFPSEIETMNSVEIVVVEEELFFLSFLILFFLCIQLKFIPLHYLFKNNKM